MEAIVVKVVEIFFWGLFIALAIPASWLLYVTFGGHVIGDLIERPPWSRTVRGIQVVLLPFVLWAGWELNFREFTYGVTAIFAGLGAYIWARTLSRGETWLWQREGRVSAEWVGPITLGGLSVGYMSSAISPWF
jgi:hypothetical protein